MWYEIIGEVAESTHLSLLRVESLRRAANITSHIGNMALFSNTVIKLRLPVAGMHIV